MISELPEEKIEEICQQMDDVTLSQFIQTSKTHHRICGEILKQREVEYDRLIDEILTASKNNRLKEIHLYSSEKNRIFILKYNPHGYPSGSKFALREVIQLKPTLALTKLGWTQWQDSIDQYAEIESDNDITDILLILFGYGYLNGKYKIQK